MPKIESGYIKKELPKNIGKIGLILLVAGIILSLAAYLIDPARAAFGYLTAFVFLICIGLGSLFLVTLEYSAGAVWSVPFRRISEFYASSVPYFVLLVIPLFFSMHNLFIWMDPAVVAKDTVLQVRMKYLNVPFFVIRDVAIFLIWWLFYVLLTRNSRKQDASADQNLTTKNIKLSMAFLPVFAFSISIISFDWIMSMSPKWFSTIFGVYLFAGSTWVALAVLTLSAVLLTENGYLSPKVKRDHYYSLGTLLFAFTVFWAYIAFAQYMLQWYGNLPEEITYFIHRWTGGWKYFSMALVMVHFIVPFLILLPRSSKTNPKVLIFVSVWIIVAQYIDSYWLVMPEMVNNGFIYSFSWMDLTFPVAVAGLVIVLFNSMVKKHNLIPVGDPKLQRSYDFHL